MGHDIQIFNERSIIVNDLDMIVFVLFALDVIDSSPDPTLNAFATEWRRGLKGYGPGVFDLGLQSLLRKAGSVQAFFSILHVIESRLLGFGDVIPAVDIVAMGPPAGVTFGDYPCELVTSLIGRLRGLVGSPPSK